MDDRIISMMDVGVPTVAVLMSTYNGGKYIREQLESIFAQKGVHVKLFVRDDGSTDDTVNILYDYVRRCPFVFLHDDENVGPGESFMRLLYKSADDANVNFYAFADQDDIWLEDKLATGVKQIIGCGNRGPILYSSNQFLWVDGVNIGDRHKERQSIDLIPHLTKNTIAGCTFVFNKNLAQLLTNTERPDTRILAYRLHDAWCMLVAIACGKVIYDEGSHMLYRIHSENVVGVKEISLWEKLKKLQRLFGKSDDANLRMLTAKQLLTFEEHLQEKDKQILRLFANYQNSWSDRKKLAFNREIRNKCAENRNLFTLKVLTDFV